MKRIARADWIAEAKRRFGPDALHWKFVCPVCGHVASVQDWKDAGAPEGAVAFSCIGRYLPDGQQREAFGETFSQKDAPASPCNYSGGGFFRLNPICVTDEEGAEHEVFDFAPA